MDSDEKKILVAFVFKVLERTVDLYLAKWIWGI